VSPHHLISPTVECNLLLLSSIAPSPYCFHFRYNAGELLKGNVPTCEVNGSNPENFSLVELILFGYLNLLITFRCRFVYNGHFHCCHSAHMFPITLCALERKRFKLKVKKKANRIQIWKSPVSLIFILISHIICSVAPKIQDEIFLANGKV